PDGHWRVQLGRIDWDDGVLVRRYKRSLPIHLLHHLVFRLMLDKMLRVYFYGPHSIDMYGLLFAEAAVAGVEHLHERWSNYGLLSLCDAVIAVSDYERDYLVKKGVDPAKITVTGNGVYI